MKNTTLHNPNAGVKVVAGLIAASQVVSAAETEEKLESLEPTTVVATKFEKSLSDVSSSVAVYDVDELKAEGNISLQDAVANREPGVLYASSSGQRGQTSNLFVRGLTTKYIQTRVDGVKLSPQNGAFSFNYLGVTDLGANSSVEILKGPSSSLYGGGAAGGVINLELAKGSEEPNSEIKFDYGSFDSAYASFRTQGQIGKLFYHLGASEESTDNDTNNVIKDSHFNQTSYFARFDYDLGNGATIGATIRSGDADYGVPEYGNVDLNETQSNDYDHLFTTLFYENEISDQWVTKLTIGYNEDDFDNAGYIPRYVFNPMLGYSEFVPGEFDQSRFESNLERFSVNWDSKYTWSEKHETTAGLYFEELEFTSTFGGDERRNRGAYISHVASVTDQLTLNGSFSAEEHERYGTETSWNAGVVLTPLEGTVVKVNTGSAFVGPTSGQLSSDGGDQLEGERVFSWDVTVEQNIGEAVATLAWFETDIDNQIRNRNFFPAPADYYNDSGKQKVSGLEFGLKAPIESLNSEVYVSYTYLDRKANILIPEQSVSAGVNTQLCEKLSVGLDASWVDKRFTYHPIQLDDYLLVKLSANYELNENVTLHARVENLLDDDNELFEDNQFSVSSPGVVKGRGRGFYGGATITF